MISVDILPTSIPLDASQQFSQSLLPYLESLIETFDRSKSDYTKALERATITEEGKLAENHTWLQDAVKTFHAKAATTETVGSSTEMTTSIPQAKHGLLAGSCLLMCF